MPNPTGQQALKSAYDEHKRRHKIVIFGLPGSGKTTLARAILDQTGGVHLNGDEVRKSVSRDLGFSPEDRIEQARRIGWMADRVVDGGGIAVADFICPTEACRAAVQEGGPAFFIWVDRIVAGRYQDTNKLWEDPHKVDVHVLPDGTPEEWANQTIADVLPDVLTRKLPHALMIGRFQPFHDGHKALALEAIKRVGRVVFAVRDTHGKPGNPFPFHNVAMRIMRAMPPETADQFSIVSLPNITNVVYGRDVGYAIEKIELDAATESIRATDIRKLMGV